ARPGTHGAPRRRGHSPRAGSALAVSSAARLGALWCVVGRRGADYAVRHPRADPALRADPNELLVRHIGGVDEPELPALPAARAMAHDFAVRWALARLAIAADARRHGASAFAPGPAARPARRAVRLYRTTVAGAGPRATARRAPRTPPDLIARPRHGRTRETGERARHRLGRRRSARLDRRDVAWRRRAQHRQSHPERGARRRSSP